MKAGQAKAIAHVQSLRRMGGPRQDVRGHKQITDGQLRYAATSPEVIKYRLAE